MDILIAMVVTSNTKGTAMVTHKFFYVHPHTVNATVHEADNYSQCLSNYASSSALVFKTFCCKPLLDDDHMSTQS